MNKQLFLASLKEAHKSILSYAMGAALYLWLLIWIFPSMVSAKGLNELLSAMPDSVKKNCWHGKSDSKRNGFFSWRVL